jgi:hypothetical protein
VRVYQFRHIRAERHCSREIVGAMRPLQGVALQSAGVPNDAAASLAQFSAASGPS